MVRLTVVLAALLGFAAPAGAQMKVTGAGSTFAAPAFKQWFGEYANAHPEVKLDYDAIGSSAGVKKLLAHTVEFGATDVALDNAELGKNTDIVHVPITVGAVAIVFNLPGVSELKLSPAALVAIFSGQAKSWNDPLIAQDNPDATLPKGPIAVVHRSDGSGTTAIFTDYLAKISPGWKQKPGTGETVKWTAGAGAKGSDGITKMVKEKPGSIGYVDLAHANLAGLHSAAIKNASGAFVQPSILSASAAAGAAPLPADLRGSITNPPGDDVYPIAGFSYAILRKSNDPKTQALAKFLSWVVNEGQTFTSPIDYAPLPGTVVSKTNAILTSLGADAR